MMDNDELLTDDFVAGLLAKEANDCSLKYSALGMDAFRSDKKPENKPKPNTRFLRHIIKSTDSHNKALLAKEAAESRARLGDLDSAVEDKKQEAISETKSIRRKQMGDIQAILGGKKRSERNGDDAGRRHRRDGENSSSKSEPSRKERSSRGKQELFGSGDRVDRHHGRLSRDNEDRDEPRSSRRRRRDDDSDDEKRRRHRSHRDRSRSPRRRSDSREKTRSRRHRSPAERHKSPSHRDRRRREQRHEPEEKDVDSDPLEDLIGPAPAPKYRGRGTVAGSSGIDRRFSESYDPKADVDMEETVSGESNWDDAVEAFRDRQRLRQSQQERLRSAGFGDDQIQKLSRQDQSVSEENGFKWTKAGEKREWDLGKGADKEATLFREFSEDEF